NPVSILSVVSDNQEAEINILKARNELEKFVIEGSASETKVDVITTIDHNFASGIVRISREIMADIVILGWPRRAGFIEKLIGDKFRGILSNTDKTTFICSLEKPLVSHKRILIAAPPLAEHEKGFEIWLKKIAKLASELSVPIVLFCNRATENAVRKYFKKAKLSVSITINPFVDWEDFLVLSRYIYEDDLFILVSARKGATSYIGALEQLPTKIEKYFATNNRIIVYPQHLANNVTTEHYADITSEPLNKGIEAVQKIGKGIGSLFKNKDTE
ncbi:MAG: cation:proton antiporter, partial [Clostridiaceae bacterium]|nr:cation:proton antiporter [Clostridiaceae bacterium]